MMKRLLFLQVLFLLLNDQVDSFSLGNRLRSPPLTVSCSARAGTKRSLFMHMGHHHQHDHGHGHDHDHHHDDHDDNHHETEKKRPLTPLSLWGQLMRPREAITQGRTSGKVLIAALMVLIPALFRRKLTRVDLGIFAAGASVLTVFDSLRAATKQWIARVKRFQESLVKHSTPLTRKYFFKNDNAADRITLVGVYINILLSVAKFVGGIMFHSAVLVADAGHSLSDLFSDFITLWAVQIARLPADEDHPYGHGKFESVGSLFLSLTLLATGLSVGAWSYETMLQVLAAQKAAGIAGAAASIVQIPSWPALALAAVSIASKEWLYRITIRVGEAMNSQILIANAWHHRSDAFSSVLSLVSIAAAILLPGCLVLDSGAGMFVAGMICLTGLEVMFESVKQLTDTSDKRLAERITSAAGSVEGVLGVKQVRARTIGSGSLVDMTTLTDAKISTTAANAIGEQTRWRIIENFPQVMDVMVRTQATHTVCPLLSATQRPVKQVEKEIRDVLATAPEVKEVKRVTVHYIDSGAVLYTEAVIKVDPDMSVRDSQLLAKRLQQSIVKGADVFQADIHLDISPGEEIVAAANTPSSSSSSSSTKRSTGSGAGSKTAADVAAADVSTTVKLAGAGYGFSARMNSKNNHHIVSPSLEVVHTHNARSSEVGTLVDALKQGVGYGLSARIKRPAAAPIGVAPA